MVKIFIDPGHGGNDPGATGNGLLEKTLTLQIASLIRDILVSEYNNVEVRMSRTGDQTVSLGARTNAANSWGADFYLSVHINSGGGVGFETFVYPGVGNPTTTYRQILHEEILKAVNFPNRGQKQANFHVLRESNMAAVLTENGFIDSRTDTDKLRTASFREALARGHVNGLARAFNLPRKSPTPAPTPPQNTETLFRVQIGAFRNQTNANALAREARTKGFETYVFQESGLYKIQIGAFEDRAGADQLVARAKAAGLDAVVISD